MTLGVFVHRTDSIYDDSPAERYQFPAQYLGRAWYDRWLAVAMDARSLIEQRAGDRDHACAAAKQALRQWAVVRNEGAVMQ